MVIKRRNILIFVVLTFLICAQLLLTQTVFAQTYGSDTYGGSEYGGTAVSSGGGGGGGGSNRSSNSSTITTTTATSTDPAIAALLMQVAELQARLAYLKGQNASTATTGSLFLRDLEWGFTDPDVRRLQQFLNTHGYPVNVGAGAVGSMGHETDFFGVKTKDAVIRFQLANAIVPAVGYFGPITRALVNSLLQ